MVHPSPGLVLLQSCWEIPFIAHFTSVTHRNQLSVSNTPPEHTTISLIVFPLLYVLCCFPVGSSSSRFACLPSHPLHWSSCCYTAVGKDASPSRGR